MGGIFKFTQTVLRARNTVIGSLKNIVVKTDDAFGHVLNRPLENIYERATVKARFFQSQYEKAKVFARDAGNALFGNSGNGTGASMTPNLAGMPAAATGRWCGEAEKTKNIMLMSTKKNSRKKKMRNFFLKDTKQQYDKDALLKSLERVRDDSIKLETIIRKIKEPEKVRDFTGGLGDFKWRAFFMNSELKEKAGAYKLPPHIFNDMDNIAFNINNTFSSPRNFLSYYKSSDARTNNLIIKHAVADEFEEHARSIDALIFKVKNGGNFIEAKPVILHAQPHSETSFQSLERGIDSLHNAIFADFKKRASARVNKSVSQKTAVIQQKKIFEKPDYKTLTLLPSSLSGNHKAIIKMNFERSFNRNGSVQISNPHNLIADVKETANKIDCLQMAVLGHHISPEAYFKTVVDLRRMQGSIIKKKITDVVAASENMTGTFSVDARSNYVGQLQKLHHQISSYSDTFRFSANNLDSVEIFDRLDQRRKVIEKTLASVKKLNESGVSPSKTDALFFEMTEKLHDIKRTNHNFFKNNAAKLNLNGNTVLSDVKASAPQSLKRLKDEDFVHKFTACRDRKILVYEIEKDGWVLSSASTNHDIYKKNGVSEFISIPRHSGDVYNYVIRNAFKAASWR